MVSLVDALLVFGAAGSSAVKNNQVPPVRYAIEGVLIELPNLFRHIRQVKCCPVVWSDERRTTMGCPFSAPDQDQSSSAHSSQRIAPLEPNRSGTGRWPLMRAWRPDQTSAASRWPGVAGPQLMRRASPLAGPRKVPDGYGPCQVP